MKVSILINELKAILEEVGDIQIYYSFRKSELNIWVESEDGIAICGYVVAEKKAYR